MKLRKALRVLLEGATTTHACTDSVSAYERCFVLRSSKPSHENEGAMLAL